MKLLFAFFLLLAAPTWAAMVDYEVSCPSQLSKEGIESSVAADICQQAIADAVNVAGCKYWMTHPTKKDGEEIPALLSWEGQAQEICEYLKGYSNISRQTRTQCIDTVLKHKTPRGRPAVVSGQFKFANWQQVVEVVSMTEKQVAQMACAQNNDAVIGCALGPMGVFDRQDMVTEVDDQSWKKTAMIDHFWNDPAAQGNASKAFMLAVGFCRGPK